MNIILSGEHKVQSPYLYLQSVGSDASDGSAPGIHLRWDLLRNLGDTHLPKGNLASGTVNFNRANDFVKLYRSQYNQRYESVVDLSTDLPITVDDVDRFWVFQATGFQFPIYLYFRNPTQYDLVRTQYNPATNPLDFVRNYGNNLIEVDSPQELFFAANLKVEATPGAQTQMRIEGLSVEENVPLPEKFVSCRKVLDVNDLCGEPSNESCCNGPNLIPNPSFELNGGFSTDYTLSGTALPGRYGYVSDASTMNPRFWIGTPQDGNRFLAFDGSTSPNQVAVGYTLPVQARNRYCFSFWAINLDPNPGAVLQISIQGNFSGTVNFTFPVTGQQGVWTQFQDYWTAGPFDSSVTIKIIATTTAYVGNDFGLDNLSFCEANPVKFAGPVKDPGKGDETPLPETGRGTTDGPSLAFDAGKGGDEIPGSNFRGPTKGEEGEGGGPTVGGPTETSKCEARIVSENMRGVRFDVNGGFVSEIRLETYRAYINNATWSNKGSYALTTDTGTAMNRLENFGWLINGLWEKFNDGAKVRVQNYQDRWTQPRGLGFGVQEYITLSNTDPLAQAILPGANPVDGSIQVSYLDMLKLVALDFHAARMLGVGTIDNFSVGNGDYIYLMEYRTEGELDDFGGERPVAHYYMGIPTSKTDFRLPPVPKPLPVTYGLFIENATNQPTNLTDDQGYTPDGRSRFINVLVEQDPQTSGLGPFFVPSDEFCSEDQTEPVFFGLEYKKQGEAQYRKPELSNDPTYQDLDSPAQNETIPLPNHGEQTKPIYIHQETESGIHEYAVYGINWFSRVSDVSAPVLTDQTQFVKANTLLPPANFRVQLIQSENPLILTTGAEQWLLGQISGTDKTLVRVTFDYFHTHDLNYDYGDEVELFFRKAAPQNILGAVKSVVDDPTDNRKAIVRTESYVQASTGVTVSPTIAGSLLPQFVGGVMVVGSETFIVDDAVASNVSGEGPVFTVLKIEEGTAIDPNGTGQFTTILAYNGPEEGALFMAVENMADPASWGSPNPLTKKVTIGDGSWASYTDNIIEDGEPKTEVTRGIWESATIADLPDAYSNVIGVYTIQFSSYVLGNHPQSGDPDPVDWYKGIVRIPKASDPNGPRKVLEVLKVENVGTSSALRITAADATYDASDPIQTGSGITVNYYPGYKLYLYADIPKNFVDGNILPLPGEGSRKTYMASRTLDTANNYTSPVGVPDILFAQELIDPLPPELPTGAVYANRPDFFYKSTYAFNVAFQQQPFAAAFYRATEERLLTALYKPETVTAVKKALKELGDDDPYRSDRWKNMISFDYAYSNPSNPYYDPTGSNPDGTFRRFPREPGNYRFPRPDRAPVFDGTQEPGAILVEVQDAIYGAFTPLTEQPLMWQYIEGGSYEPNPLPQNVRNAQGHLLDPSDDNFRQAPMAKVIGTNEIRFVDFTLDGAGNSLMFYSVREIGNRGKIGDPSPVLGPVFLVNARPPEAPIVRKFESTKLAVEGIPAGDGIQFEINGYSDTQRVDRLRILRAFTAVDALTVRTMEVAAEFEVADLRLLPDSPMRIVDAFDGVTNLPYGEPLYYRLVALRRIKDPDGNIDYAPSQPSKLLVTTLVDELTPVAVTLTATVGTVTATQLQNVTLLWNNGAPNGRHALYQEQNGVWMEIYNTSSNPAQHSFTLPQPLERAETHRFKVRVWNASGLTNLEENVFSISGDCGDLAQLPQVVNLADSLETYTPLKSGRATLYLAAPGSLTFTDVTDVAPWGHTFGQLEITVVDAANNSHTLNVNTAGGSVTFNDGDGGLDLSGTTPNQNYAISVKVITDVCPTGFVHDYVLEYFGNPCVAVQQVGELLSYTDATQTYSPFRSRQIDQTNPYPGSMQFTDIMVVPTGHTFDKIEILVEDGLGNTHQKVINTSGGTVTFNDGEGGLVLGSGNPNASLQVTGIFYTDLCPTGVARGWDVDYI
ncbi:MAG: hypothetical protein AAGN35_16070 [Bacteroidota bacterium]